MKKIILVHPFLNITCLAYQNTSHYGTEVTANYTKMYGAQNTGLWFDLHYIVTNNLQEQKRQTGPTRESMLE
jgi:ribosomal protein S24E